MTAPIALVTGASAGIGVELARGFAARGYDLVLVARRSAELEVVASELRGRGRMATTLVQDLALPDAPRALHEAVAARGLSVDVLVNNAGIAFAGAFSELDPDALQRMVQLNVGTLAVLTRLFLDGMLKRRRGRILNVGSVAGFQPVPVLTAYAATKAFVLTFTEALAEELRGTGVTVTALCPGLTDTEMGSELRRLRPDLPPPPSFLLSDVASVAREGVDACLAGEVLRVPGVANQLSTFWSRTQPRWVVRTLGGLVARQILAKP